MCIRDRDGSDVLYVDYEAVEPGLKRSLIRSTDKGKSTLASGQAASYDQVPALFCLNGQPMYCLLYTSRCV